MLTYALGRGVEYYDVETVDQIMARLEAGAGHFSALLLGIIESTPFQKQRAAPTLAITGRSQTETPQGVTKSKL